MIDVTVAVCTFGDSWWSDLAAQRAIPSAVALGVPVVTFHCRTLAEARNAAAASVKTEYLCYLDADDELEPGFFEDMDASADIWAVPVRYLRHGRHRPPPKFPHVSGAHLHDCGADCLRDGNWLIVGCPVRTELAKYVEWQEWLVYEDWAWWLEMYLSNPSLTIKRAPASIYRAYVRPDSRNRGGPAAVKRRTHYDIASSLMPEKDWSHLL